MTGGVGYNPFMPLGSFAPQGAPIRLSGGTGTGGGGPSPRPLPTPSGFGGFTPPNTVPSIMPSYVNNTVTQPAVLARTIGLGDENAMILRARGMRNAPSAWAVPDSLKLLQGQIGNIQLQNELSRQAAAQNYYWQMALLNARGGGGGGGGSGAARRYAIDTYNNQLKESLLAYQNAARQLQSSATARGAMTSRGYLEDLAAAKQAQTLADEQARITRDRQLAAASGGGGGGNMLGIQKQALSASYQQALLNGDIQTAQAIYQVLGSVAGANGGSLPAGFSLPTSLTPSTAPAIPRVTSRVQTGKV